MTESAIEVRGMRYAWPGQALLLRIEHLAVRRGERLLLQGPSGCGKSTLLSLFGGVLVPQNGSVEVLGRPLQQLAPAQRDRFRGDHVGFIFQMFNLLPYLSVRANVSLPLRFSSARTARISGAGVEAEVDRLLASLGLRDPALLSRRVTELSIGQQQRVAAARALLGRPELIIADEPTSALDPQARTDFLALLGQECRSAGSTLVVVSHDLSLQDHFDRVIRLPDLSS